MKYHFPLNQILTKTRPSWDRDQTRPAVRRAFTRALQCGTLELGAEVYGLEGQELIVEHTCKSRACASCGYRATVQWLRERWAALPETNYKGITFTMPIELWPIFHDNPRLARALPPIAAKVIEAQVGTRYGIRIGVIAILHTFNGKLEFNSHVHTMVTGGGYSSAGTWSPSVYYKQDLLLKAWRRAVIALLHAALRAGQLHTAMTVDQVEALLTYQKTRWWSIKINSFKYKTHFLKYAGRYAKRPPIAQRRITFIGERIVRFWFKDKRLHRRVEIECSIEEFVDRWGQHIPEIGQHSVRGFGLFAPRSLSQTSAAIFAILRQERPPRPKARPWANSINKDFGHDPLLLPTGKRMKWLRRLPKISPMRA